jgi:hypothetical protein
MARTHYRVLPSGSAWVLRREQTLLSTHAHKVNAVNEGRRVAKANPPSQLTVHRADGTIEDESTYGGDPYPPRG